MIRAEDRSPKPAPQAEPATSPAPVPSTGTVKLLLFTLAGDKMAPFGTIEVPAADLELYTEAIEKVADTQAKHVVKMGAPGKRLICTAVNDQDPEFVGKGEYAPVLGEVRTVPDVVDFFTVVKSKPTSAPLVRYYLKQRKPFIFGGYTFLAYDEFKRGLNNPGTARDLQPVALAHGEWAKANNVTPFE